MYMRPFPSCRAGGGAGSVAGFRHYQSLPIRYQSIHGDFSFLSLILHPAGAPGQSRARALDRDIAPLAADGAAPNRPRRRSCPRGGLQRSEPGAPPAGGAPLSSQPLRSLMARLRCSYSRGGGGRCSRGLCCFCFCAHCCLLPPRRNVNMCCKRVRLTWTSITSPAPPPSASPSTMPCARRPNTQAPAPRSSKRCWPTGRGSTPRNPHQAQD